jgi:frataxin
MKNLKFFKNSFILNFKLFKYFKNEKFYKLQLNDFCTDKIEKPKIDLETYVKKVNKTLNKINDHLEELEVTDNITLSDGVLKVTLNKNKHYVLNIQRPNLQIWLSSPISGPQRFEYDLSTNSWKNNRNGRDLYEILNEEMNSILKEGNINVELNFKH